MKNKTYIRNRIKSFCIEIKGIDYRYSREYYINEKGNKINVYYCYEINNDRNIKKETKISKKEFVRMYLRS